MKTITSSGDEEKVKSFVSESGMINEILDYVTITTPKDVSATYVSGRKNEFGLNKWELFVAVFQSIGNK